MKLIARTLHRLRARQLRSAVENLARVEREAAEAAEAANGLRARIIDLQMAIDRGEIQASAADITRNAERTLKRRILA